MGNKQHETGPQGQRLCPVCEQPLTMTIKGRRKTFGIFVPVWTPGRCRNPDCSEYPENPKDGRPPDR
ncbi:hypothetical protein GCM10009544_38880 [Streptomyces stramineus]|uniref:Uncharacterized protein n=1 Tax=Streptomyces stramineus TaxID=173861 RepID=A0ABN1ACJ7_9ACTN